MITANTDKIKRFCSLEIGVESEMVLMVRDLVDKVTKKGKPYVSVELFDGEKPANVCFFDETVSSLGNAGIKKGCIIKVKLTRNGKGFYNQNGFSLNDDATITGADFVKKAPIDKDNSFEWLLNKVNEVDSNPDCVGPYKSLSHLTYNLLKENEDAFKYSSAAVTMHHNFISGLLYHTERMVSMAEKACEVYRTLDKELLVCAAAIHDIGKISCYKTSDMGNAEVTVEGRLLDHAVSGIMMIHDAAGKELYNPERIQMLLHMVASHHGKKEWDAITTPAFPEAEMLHIIDLADSRMNMFEEAYKEQEPGTISEEKVFGLENSYIYKPMNI